MEIASILNSIKLLLGLGEDESPFDNELIMYINGAIMVINQLGVGPDGYKITSATNEWTELLGDRNDLELVKTSIYLRVRLAFDPPQNSFLVKAIQDQLLEYDWRIEVNHNEPVVDSET